MHICTINNATLQDYWGVCGWHVGPLSVFGADADNSPGHIEPFDESCFGKLFMEKGCRRYLCFWKKTHVNRCEHFWTDVNTCWQMQTKLNNCKRMQQNVRPWFPMNLPLIHHPFLWGCWTSHDISHGHLQSGSKAPSTAFLGFHWLHRDRWSLYQAYVASWSRKWLKSSPESADEGHALVTQIPNQHNITWHWHDSNNCDVTASQLHSCWVHSWKSNHQGHQAFKKAFPSGIDPTGDSPNIGFLRQTDYQLLRSH